MRRFLPCVQSAHIKGYHHFCPMLPGAAEVRGCCEHGVGEQRVIAIERAISIFSTLPEAVRDSRASVPRSSLNDSITQARYPKRRQSQNSRHDG